MVQLPDGRMVPAQVTGAVQQQPMTQMIGQPMQIQQNLHQVPAYNPNANQIVEVQNEGEGGGTNEEEVYQ